MNSVFLLYSAVKPVCHPEAFLSTWKDRNTNILLVQWASFKRLLLERGE